MPKLTRFWCSALSLVLTPGLVSFTAMQTAVAQGPAKTVAENVAAQNALFEEYYQTGLKNSPLRATGVGDYRYNALLGDASLAEIAREHAESDAFLVRLRAIPTDGMSETDLLSHELLERQLTRSDVN